MEKIIDLLLNSGTTGVIIYFAYLAAKPLFDQYIEMIKQIGDTNRLQAKSIDKHADSVEHLSENVKNFGTSIIQRIDEAEDNIIQEIRKENG